MIKLPVLVDVLIRKGGKLERLKQLSLPEPGEYGIGRLPENEIQLDAGQVSRNHAYLVVGDNNLVVVDRDSSFGTAIGERQLDKGGSQVWDGVQPIRIQPYEIHLVREAATQAAPAPTPSPRRDSALEIDLDRPRTVVRLEEQRRKDA